MKLFLQLRGNFPHGKLLRADHGRNADRLLQTGLAGKCPGNQNRRQRIHGQNVCDPNRRTVPPADIRHSFFNSGKHVSDIGSRLPGDVPDLARSFHCGHNVLRALVQADRGRMLRIQIDFPGGKNIFPDIPVRGLDDDSAPAADQASCNRRDRAGLLGIKMQESRNPVRIGEHTHGLSGKSNLDGCLPALRNLVDSGNLIDNGDFPVNPVFHQHRLIGLKNHADHLNAVRKAIQSFRNLLVARGSGSKNNIRNRFGGTIQMFVGEQRSCCLSGSCRRRRIVADHRGICDNRLCKRFHGRVADDRRRLVQTDQADLRDVPAQRCHGSGQCGLDSVDIGRGSLGACRHNRGTGKKAHRLSADALSDTHLCC